MDKTFIRNFKDERSETISETSTIKEDLFQKIFLSLVQISKKSLNGRLRYPKMFPMPKCATGSMNLSFVGSMIVCYEIPLLQQIS